MGSVESGRRAMPARRPPQYAGDKRNTGIMDTLLRFPEHCGRFGPSPHQGTSRGFVNTPSVSRFGTWSTAITDALGLFAAVWGVALGVLLVGVPIALVVALALRLGRMAVNAL